MPRYHVWIEWQAKELYVTARTKAEAKRLVKQRVKKGTIKPKLLPHKYSETGDNPTVDDKW